MATFSANTSAARLRTICPRCQPARLELSDWARTGAAAGVTMGQSTAPWLVRVHQALEIGHPFRVAPDWEGGPIDGSQTRPAPAEVDAQNTQADERAGRCRGTWG